MHLGSADVCERIGGCLASHEPPAVFGVDAVRALDHEKITHGVVFSSGYLYGLASLELSPRAVARWTRRENEFTAAEVANYPDRLVGFLSVDPLNPSALDELRHWQGRRELVGLKLHLTASSVNIRNEVERSRVTSVIREAAIQRLPIAIHIGGGAFDASDAAIFIRTILPSAGQSWVQIAHAGGGFPLERDNHVQVLRVFADHIAEDDPRTERVLFDLSYVPAPEEGPEVASAMVVEMRRIGIKRFLFGSDYNVLTPRRSGRGYPAAGSHKGRGVRVTSELCAMGLPGHVKNLPGERRWAPDTATAEPSATNSTASRPTRATAIARYAAA
ncbi:MAG TPA: amidohydrolase family protein [Woeseiaceae bacterium]|nr:amidohydrolase family protein [Woeseiaceae bacterium]